MAIGGNDGNSSHNSVEMYDPEANRWNFLASMGSRRSSVGAAVVNCFNIELKHGFNVEMKQTQKNEKHDLSPWLSRSRTTSLN